LAPSQAALIKNTATATGWKIVRWTSFGQPRKPHQMVTRMAGR
jgi:hypothetical protein